MKTYLAWFFVLVFASGLAGCKRGDPIHDSESVHKILSDITGEGVVSASFDCMIPTYIYDIEDLTIVDELLETLDSAVFEVCDRPAEPWSSIELIYITTNENQYCLGVIQNSAFRVSINGESGYYTCSCKDSFLYKLLELQGRYNNTQSKRRTTW